MASTSSPPNEDAAQPEPNPPLENEKEKESVYKTKTIQFLGRTTPIVLQNDNGPCPLLAICNVLLLRNNLNLSPDIAEVSQEKLLHLVAERLLDSNSNLNNKDEGYIKNQQQNVADAMNLLPRLATGIDVNTKFRRIDDFEFTPECAIFDLLDIPLYHGWIVDPQDFETANAIGSKSYNALMEELVALDAESMDDLQKSNPVEDCIDFAAATAATLGVPSPSLSQTRSFNDSPRSFSSLEGKLKGDLEEEQEVLRILKLSATEASTSVPNSFVADVNEGVVSVVSEDNKSLSGAMQLDSVRLEQFDGIVKNDSALGDDSRNVMETCSEDVACSLNTDLGDRCDRLNIADSEEVSASCLSQSIADTDRIESLVSLSSDEVPFAMDEDIMGIRKRVEKVEVESFLIVDVQKPFEFSTGVTSPEISGSSDPKVDSDSSSGRVLDADAPETFTSRVESTEPIYEGEDRILDSTVTTYEEREPVYEGEVILARQHNTGGFVVEITPQQGELIRSFLKNNASQLTFYGLFSLQDGLKERELCVFFRNNHFSTMFKYNGELYLLATDQGYFNQPDLVWEKLNEVNGDTLFMTSTFKEFKVESHANDTWDEDNAMATTADYLASIDSAAQAGLDVNSDLQLAIALQQQEFEQQQQQQQQPQRRSMQQQSIGATSRLITGPQGPRSSGRTPSASSRPEAKPKDKCTLM